MKVTSYRDLIVWKKSVDLVVHIYQVTEKFPKEDMFGLVSQMRRASVSLPSNIAEGRYRGTKKDFCHFLRIAFASGAELETQLEIARRLSRISMVEYEKVNSQLGEVMRMLNVMISKLV